MFCLAHALFRKVAEDAMKDSHCVELPPAWEMESPMTKRLLLDGSINQRARFWRLDTWHCLHLGIGKCWIASAMTMLQVLVPERHMDKRYAVLSSLYRDFCKKNKIPPIIKKFDKFSFGFASSEPNGTWNKAAVTSNLMLFLEDFCEQNAEKVMAHERFRYIVSCMV